jgi:hypothetical protein
MFDYFVASAKLLQLFLVIFLCSVFIPIEDFFLGTAAAAAAVNEITTGSMAAVGSDAICGTAAAWFHVVDYAC